MKELEESVVGYVIDGDTLELIDGNRVRIIGIDAPELGRFGDEDEPFAIEATEFAKKIAERQKIWLQAEGNNKDVHGRLRRHIWIDKPTDVNCTIEAKEKLFSSKLLLQGYASVMIIGDVKHEDLFKKLENIAISNCVGIWSF